MKVDLAAHARDFSRVLSQARAESKADFEWYRYDSLSNLGPVSAFWSDDLLTLAREKGVLDVGCGDGDLSFFFESLGCDVVAIDHPGPNHNGMRGVRRLKETLNSKIDIREVDLDSQFERLDRRFGLTLFLGALYHVKNPFYILETLAKCSDRCLMSTRIARQFPHMGRVPDNSTLAYLLDSEELNADDSNFWIFSEAGLKLLLKRTWWTVCDFRTLGDTSNSDPNSIEHDERAFCLLQSRYGMANVELISGWNAVEQGGWRWTERIFTIRIQPGPSRVTMRVFIPPELLTRLGTIRMEIRCGDVRLAPAVFDKPGIQTITRTTRDLTGDVIVFELDRAIPRDPGDSRERGIIVAAIGLE